MRCQKKLTITLRATAVISSLSAVAWFIVLLLTSPSEPDGFGQDHQEQWAVAACWRAIRDGQINGTEQCNEYAQAHLEFFTHELAIDAATTTCNLSRSHLDYALHNSPDATALLQQLRLEVKEDCPQGIRGTQAKA